VGRASNGSVMSFDDDARAEGQRTDAVVET
jgi:hypothetical protein